jgi:ribonuclease BN (tRNA processing enzyme)
MRVRGAAGGLLTFSSDVAPCEALPESARDVDLFLCESAVLTPNQDDPDPRKRGHMSAAEAGVAAAQANARRLLITHYRSDAAADRHHLEAARRAYGGPIDLARPGATYTVA